MDEVCAGLPFTFVYIDDVLIASPDLETHLQHLRLVLQWFQQNGLVINPAKCKFGRFEIDFLGHHVSAAGASPLLKHVEAIKVFPQPQDHLQIPVQ